MPKVRNDLDSEKIEYLFEISGNSDTEEKNKNKNKMENSKNCIDACLACAIECEECEKPSAPDCCKKTAGTCKKCAVECSKM